VDSTSITPPVVATPEVFGEEARSPQKRRTTTTLLEKARLAPCVRRSCVKVTGEDIELALAWVKGEITLAQATTAWGHNTTNATYGRLALCLREAVNQRKVKVIRLTSARTGGEGGAS
jgi:hypothetical protein